jgi:ribonuclease J
VRVFAPLGQRIRVEQEEAFERVRAVRASRIYPEDLERQAGLLVMTFRYSMRADMERAGCLAGAGALWSMWPGYLTEPAGRATTEWLEDRGIPLTIAHTSGHATIADLRRLVAALAPERVVPVHTAAPELFSGFFPRVDERADGEWWSV